MARLPKNVVRRGGVFYYRARVGGKEIRRSLGRHLVEARRQALLLRQELAVRPQEVSPAKDVLTVEGFAKQWLTEYVAQRRNGKGVELASQRVRDFVVPAFGALPLSALRTIHLRGLRGDLEARTFGRAGKHLSPQSIRHALADVRCLLRYAVEVGAIELSPFRSSVMPRIVETAPKRMTDGEVARVLSAASRAEAFTIKLALLTGMRWGEVRRLQWRHVQRDPMPHLVLEQTKSGKVRRVPLSQEAVELLREERTRTSSVFVAPLRIKNFGPYAARIGRKAGVGWHYHMLRHTFACRYLEAGGSKEALQRILGHSTIRLTEKYGALSDEAVFAEMQRITSKFRPEVGTEAGTPAALKLAGGRKVDT